MSESFPVQNIIEQSISGQVNSMIGTNDTNLNTIVKMAMMTDLKQMNTIEMNEVLERIVSSNQVEKYFVEKDYELTIDHYGNIIPVNSIDATKERQEREEEGQNEKDTGSIIREPERSE